MKIILGLGLSACLFASTANANLLTFDNAGTVSNQSYASYQGLGDTYTQEGFTLTVGGGDHFDSMTSSGLYWHDGAANQHHNNYAVLTFSGGYFDLTSFDFTRYGGDFVSEKTSLGTYSAGTNVVNLTGIQWAAFSPQGNSNRGIYLDNIEVSASTVPEPSIIALLGLGFAGLGFTRRKKRS